MVDEKKLNAENFTEDRRVFPVLGHLDQALALDSGEEKLLIVDGQLGDFRVEHVLAKVHRNDSLLGQIQLVSLKIEVMCH